MNAIYKKRKLGHFGIFFLPEFLPSATDRLTFLPKMEAIKSGVSCTRSQPVHKVVQWRCCETHVTKSHVAQLRATFQSNFLSATAMLPRWHLSNRQSCMPKPQTRLLWKESLTSWKSASVDGVTVISTGNERTWLTVILACTTYSHKLPPFIVFQRKTVPKSNASPWNVVVPANEKGFFNKWTMLEWFTWCVVGIPAHCFNQTAC